MNEHIFTDAICEIALSIRCETRQAAVNPLEMESTNPPGIQSCRTLNTISGMPSQPVVWLFVVGMLTLLGFDHRSGLRKHFDRKPRSLGFMPNLLLLASLVLISPIGYTAPDFNSDLNGDVVINSLDISKLTSCYGQDPASNRACTLADVDIDGDIDRDDFSFVSARLGQAYPERLFLSPELVAVSYEDVPSVTLGDLNGDSVLDLVVGYKETRSVSVQLGNGDGSFQSQSGQGYPLGQAPRSVVLGDLNGDGILDMVISIEDTFLFYENGEAGIAILLGNGDGSFQTVQKVVEEGDFYEVVLTDLNGDGALDFLVNAVLLKQSSCCTYEYELMVIFGNGDGSFKAAQRIPSGSGWHGTDANWDPSMATGDVNGDGAIDIIFPDGFMMLGNGDGNFEPGQRLDVTGVVALNDLNGDGDVDMILDNGDMLLGNGDGSFEPGQRISSGGSVVIGDVNGDGVVDLVFSGQGVLVMLGNGDGTFTDQTGDYIGNDITIDSTLLGDISGNGQLDLVVVGHSSSMSISSSFMSISGAWLLLNRSHNL